MRKNFGKWKILEFLVSNWDFFGGNTAIISSENPTGQQTSAMLSVFNILIHEVYRKFDKNSIKTLKFEKKIDFLSFLGLFLSEKLHLSRHRQLLDNEFLLNFFNIRFHDIYQKTDKNCIKK